MTGFVVLLILAAVAIAWLVYKPSPSRGSEPAGNIARIQGPGKYAYEVVGESFYSEHFERLLGQSAGSREEWFGDAMLVLEDNNPADPNAVAVTIGDMKVGHLPRELAKEFRAILPKSANTAGRQSFAVGARVWAGGTKRRYSVTIDLPST